MTHVVTIEGGSSASVEGFTIQNGYNWLGGGLYIDGKPDDQALRDDGQPSLWDCCLQLRGAGLRKRAFGGE